MARLDYSGVPTVNPQTGSGDDLQHISPSPDAFGASIAESKGQIANANMKLGQAITGASETAAQIAFKQQGMINEAAATDGETGAIQKYGNLLSEYKTKEGLAAVSARPDYEEKIKAVRGEIEAAMPSDAARRAFTLMARRHEANALLDINSYATGQIKAADNKSALASLDQSVAQSNIYSVASNDGRFSDATQTADFQIARVLTNQGWGPEGGTGMSQNPQTGEITFNDTENGQKAKSVYEQLRDKAHGQAWDNRLHAIADDPTHGDIKEAIRLFEANRDKIPAEAQAKLAGWLEPKARAAQVQTAAAQRLASVNQDYKASLSGPGGGGKIDDAILAQESNLNARVATSVDGAVGIGQVMPDTFRKYAKPGEDINDPKANEAVSRRIIADYNTRWPNDPARVAVAYFSGPGNVAPAGSPNPWIKDAKDGNDKSVSSYVADVTKRVGGNDQQPTSGYQSPATHIQDNYTKILADTDAQSERDHPGDLAYQQSVHTLVEQHLNDVVRQQTQENRADQLNLIQAADGAMTNGVKPTTLDQLLAMGPKMRQSYENLLLNNPSAVDGLEKLLTANSRGQPNGYGNKFYDFYQQAISGAKDPMKFANYVNNGPNGDLTTEGFKEIKNVIERNHTPQGTAMADAERRFFQTVHSQLTFTNPKTYLHDPKGEENFTKFMQATLPSIAAGLKAGKTPQQLFDPKSSDYVGASAGMFMRPINQFVQDQINASTLGNPGQINSATGDNKKYDLNTPEGLKAAVNDNVITANEGYERALSKKWIRPKDTGPQVPRPTD